MKRTTKLLTLTAFSGFAATGAFAQFNTLETWGDAAGTTPPASFTSDGVTSTITAGGADFWGGSDAGAFLWDNAGNLSPTGDFTAAIRHVSTTNPAPEWGRDGILVRAAPSGVPAANDPNWLSFRKSNGQVEAGRRETVGGGTELSPLTVSDLGAINSGNVATTPYFLSAARDGNTMRAGAAIDLGGTPGRWVETGASVIAAFATGNKVIVGLGHQSHPQTISPDTNDINTATFDKGAYTPSYVSSYFGPAAGAGATPWSIGGALAINPNGGAVNGRNFVQVGGVATGEANRWTINAGSGFVPSYGAAGAVRRTTAMEAADIVPAANFRRSAALPTGLTADIYLAGNAGNLAGNQATIAAGPINGTTVINNINWTGGDVNATNYYQGTSSDFRTAVANGTGPANTFGDTNQENYGVHMTGEIYIESDANRKGQYSNIVLFKDGIDDYTYLNIDGQVLLDDNDWTGYNSVDNSGGHVTAMNVSDPKFDDGEWVSFDMIMWEGGGGDNGVLYTDMNDVNGTFLATAPGAYTTSLTQTGTNQVGTESADGSFGFVLPNGQWDVSLTVENTATSATFLQSVTVVPEPTAPLLVGLAGIGLVLRRRRNR